MKYLRYTFIVIASVLLAILAYMTFVSGVTLNRFPLWTSMIFSSTLILFLIIIIRDYENVKKGVELLNNGDIFNHPKFVTLNMKVNFLLFLAGGILLPLLVHIGKSMLGLLQ